MCTQLSEISSLKTIARQTNLSTSTIIRILNLINRDKPTLPAVLSIDEFKGNADGDRYQCILIDGHKRRTLYILPSRKQQDLISYFKSFPKF